ncbi:MAG TPA: response regulator transcription factor [Acidobacteriota bacterium]|nr:response regulator transcription factor [Acidobacteriota bacterium]
MIKVLVADDHPVVREGLKRIIEKDSAMLVAAEAGTSQEVLDRLVAQLPDVVLLDINMPGRGGLEVLQQIKLHYSSLPVLVVSMYPEDQYATRVLRAGAAGYLTKESAPSQLVNAIRKVVRGGKYVSPTLAEKLAIDLGTESKLPHESLSDREYQVLCLLASAKTVSEIADELSLSIKTISTYRTRILEKMDLKNNVELARYALKHGLVD